LSLPILAGVSIPADVQSRRVFKPYLPRLVVEWWHERAHRLFAVVPGSLASVDISGFTSLSERLQAKGRMVLRS
jgi:hypothetical protein